MVAISVNVHRVDSNRTSFQASSLSAASSHPLSTLSLSRLRICLKFSLFVVNLVFVIFGAVLIAVGSYALNQQVASTAGANIPIGLIVLGAFIIFFAIIGAASSHREWSFGLLIYLGFVSVLSVTTFIISMMVYLYKDASSSFIQNYLWPSLSNAGKLDLEQAFSCCGLVHYNDTDASQPCWTFSQNPCLTVLVNSWSQSYKKAGGTGIAFSILMGVLLVFVWYLRNAIKEKQKADDEKEEEKRKREKQKEGTDHDDEQQQLRQNSLHFEDEEEDQQHEQHYSHQQLEDDETQEYQNQNPAEEAILQEAQQAFSEQEESHNYQHDNDSEIASDHAPYASAAGHSETREESATQ